MRETRLYGSEGGGAARSPYPYPDARVAPKREQNSLFDVHNRLMNLVCAGLLFPDRERSP